MADRTPYVRAITMVSDQAESAALVLRSFGVRFASAKNSRSQSKEPHGASPATVASNQPHTKEIAHV